MTRKTHILIFLSLTIAACGAPSRTTTSTTAPLSRSVLAQRRAAAIQRLHDYGVAGEFPTDAARMPLAVFRDDHGRRCPMSELIFASGHAALVDRVVRENNQLRLADVDEGPVLEWILGSGLTQEETIAIQGLMEITPAVTPEPDTARRQAAARVEIQRRIAERERQLQAGTEASLVVAASRAP